MKCHYCSKSIDPEHDKHYYCKRDKKIVVFKQCYLSHPKCPECSKGLQFKDDSIMKKCFYNPATRNGLGF